MKISLVVLAMGLVSTQCSKNEEAPAEAVAAASADAPGAPVDAPPPEPTVTDLKAEAVYFGFDDYTLSSQAQGKLDGLSSMLKAGSSSVVQIEGHCDERGSTEYNLALGQKRAEAVRKYLEQVGVGADRLSVTSYGEERPAADGHDEAAWGQNRRVEFVVSQSR